MATCYLFAHHLDAENGLSLRLDDSGCVDAALERRTIDEIKLLQAHARTIVVLPTEQCSLHELELPWLGERKAREAIPYALEDEVAQSVATLHFAFDRQNYQNNRYLIAVIDKQRLIDLQKRLEALNLAYDLITLDWFALKASEACVSENSLLVADQAFKGALSLELASVYLQKQAPHESVMVFSDSPPISNYNAITTINCPSHVWIAQRLEKAQGLNLCQGEFKHDVRQQTSRRYYQISAVLACVWLLSLLLMNAVKVQMLNGKLAIVNQQTAEIYHTFFPQASQVISPRFRISEWLKHNGSQSNQVLWPMLNQLAVVFHRDQFNLEQFRFQNQSLIVTISCKDFAALEQIQSLLQQKKVQVKQIDAATHAGKVVATLELTL